MLLKDFTETLTILSQICSAMIIFIAILNFFSTTFTFSIVSNQLLLKNA